MVVNAEIDPTTLSKLFATGPRYCYARRQFRRVLFAHGAFISRALSCRMEFFFYFFFFAIGSSCEYGSEVELVRLTVIIGGCKALTADEVEEVNGGGGADDDEDNDEDDDCIVVPLVTDYGDPVVGGADHESDSDSSTDITTDTSDSGYEEDVDDDTIDEDDDNFELDETDDTPSASERGQISIGRHRSGLLVCACCVCWLRSNVSRVDERR
jgi:hypothetical protein